MPDSAYTPSLIQAKLHWPPLPVDLVRQPLEGKDWQWPDLKVERNILDHEYKIEDGSKKMAVRRSPLI